MASAWRELGEEGWGRDLPEWRISRSGDPGNKYYTDLHLYFSTVALGEIKNNNEQIFKCLT